MSEVVGEAVYKIRTDESGVDFDGAGQRAGTAFGSGFGKTARRLATGFLGGLVVKEAYDFLAGSTDRASDLNESLNAVNVTYGKQAAGVKRLGRQAADSLGLSNERFNALSVRFSSFATTIAGGPGKKVVSTLDNITTRASDFASVMNLEVADAAALFQSGLAGETEPLRQYGIDLSAAKVEAFALSEGIVKNKADLDESAKVQARYALLMEQTAKAQGDFSNTSTEAANAQRILDANVENARARLGTAFLPLVKDLSGFLLREGVPALEDFSDWFVEDGGPALERFVEDAKPVVQKYLPKIGDLLSNAADVGKTAAGYVGTLVDAFDEVPPWAQKLIIGGGAAAFTAKKLGLDQLLGKGATAALAPVIARGSRANPMYVIDLAGGTNGPGGHVGSDGERTDRNGRPRPSRGSAVNLGLLTLFGIPVAADAGASGLNKLLGGREATDADKTREDRFLERWGTTTQQAIHDAFGGLAQGLGIPKAGPLPGGRGAGAFSAISGTDFFLNTKGANQELSDLTGEQLRKLNEKLRETYGVGLPALARQGFVDASVIAKLELGKQQAIFQQTKDKANEYFTVIRNNKRSDLFLTVTGWSTAIGQEREYIENLLQIRALHQETRLDRAGGSGGANGGIVPQDPPTGPGNPGDEDPFVPSSSSSQPAGVVIHNANFHDWNGHDAEVRRYKRLASVGGRRVGSRVPA